MLKASFTTSFAVEERERERKGKGPGALQPLPSFLLLPISASCEHESRTRCSFFSLSCLSISQLSAFSSRFSLRFLTRWAAHFLFEVGAKRIRERNVLFLFAISSGPVPARQLYCAERFHKRRVERHPSALFQRTGKRCTHPRWCPFNSPTSFSSSTSSSHPTASVSFNHSRHLFYLPPPFSPFRLFYYFIYYVFCRSNKETNPGRADQHVFRSTCSDVLRPLEIGRADENVGKCRTGDKTESYCISSETFQRPKKMQRNPILHVFSFEPSTSKTELSLASV